ncbi:MAG: 50S ribosomal protein L25 [Bryobacteraceae bacterium]
MKKEITVSASPRDTRGKNEARRTRAAGKIPAVIYGAYKDPVAVAVNPKDILSIMRSASGANTIFNLAIEGGETAPAMLVDEQTDPVRGTLLHVDFKRIDLSKPIRVTVPVQTTGDAKGVKQQGGLLELVSRSLEIECLPNEIPEHFTVDVTELMIGDAMRASDVSVTGSMRLLSPADTVLAHVVALRGEEEAKPAEAAPAEGAPAAAAEPEVIKKGKKEEEGGEAKKK